MNPLSKVLRLCSVFTSVGAALLFAAALVAEAQPAGKVYRISFLGLTPGEESTSMKPLLERLHELGYSQGKEHDVTMCVIRSESR